MRKIVRTISSYFPAPVSGPANQAREISRRLASHGYESTILTTRLHAGDAPAHELRDGAEVVRLPLHGSFMQYHVALGIFAELWQRPAHLIHAHGHRNFFTDAGAFIARQRRIPFIVHLHGTLASYRSIAPPSTWWLYRGHDMGASMLGVLRANRCIVSTHEERVEAERYGVDPQRIAVIPMGINADDYVFPEVPRDPQRIVFVGRLTEDRNPELVLRALARIIDQPWTCAFVGDETRRSFATGIGYVNHLQQLAQGLGIAERVTFTGQLSGAALRQEYARSGIFVYPSRSENFGQTILEAAAAGCALVTSAVGVAHELVHDGATGFRIDPDNPHMLAQRLGLLLQSPATQRAMAANLQERVRRTFGWQQIEQRYADLYDEAISEHTQRPDRLWLGTR